jgi:uncharacterized membrane protein YadS
VLLLRINGVDFHDLGFGEKHLNFESVYFTQRHILHLVIVFCGLRIHGYQVHDLGFGKLLALLHFKLQLNQSLIEPLR